ncbi:MULTISPECIES: ABC transporter substrate-binding protein [Sphingomonas]|uniref:ABC transporter substrate-binding protein n=1 Tax=Sphingomonas TaxID=13687 RepID=UPI00082BCBE8|nr:ABC transporter substrate-binding protein [Sphingomonas sp. CCH10-B3]
MRRLVASLLALAATTSCAPAAAPDSPSALRVASINPCVDAMLRHLADPQQIAAISHYSQDPDATSVPLGWARRFRATSGTAEEIVALRPTVVLSGAHVQPATVAALRRVGIKLVEYPVPATVAESIAQIRDIGRRLGHPARGDALARAVEIAATPTAAEPVAALIWQTGGLTPGTGTLPDDLLSRAGFANASAGYGLKRWDVLGLEPLVARPPRILFSPAAAELGTDRLTQHPAIRRLGTHIRISPYPERLMHCGGPTIIEAMARLKDVRRGLAL